MGSPNHSCGTTFRQAPQRDTSNDFGVQLNHLSTSWSTKAKNGESPDIFILGACSFMVATAGGVIFAKLINLFNRDKINPLLGSAGVSAVPDSARGLQMVGNAEDSSNYLLMHAMAPNVAGVIGSAIVARVLWSFVG